MRSKSFGQPLYLARVFSLAGKLNQIKLGKVTFAMQKSKMKLFPVLMTALLLLGSGCANVKYVCPDLSPNIANELDRVCPVKTDKNGNEVSDCPALDSHFAACKKIEE